MKRVMIGVSVLFLAGCVEGVSEVREDDAFRAFEAVRATRSDESSGIWEDPNGCQHYIGALPDGDAYLRELLRADGSPICVANSVEN